MRHRSGDVGLTARATTQQCTQIGGNGPSEPFWGICVHCCAVVDRRGDAGVYTDWLEWPLGAVLGHSCTLLRRESRYELRRELRQVARAPQPPRRAGGAPSLAPLAWSGRQALSEWRRCQVGVFAEASTHTNPRRASYYRQFLRRAAPNRSRSAERGRPGRRSRL